MIKQAFDDHDEMIQRLMLHRLAQRQLANKQGKPQNYVGRVETEQRRLDFIELPAWFKACGVDAQEAVLALAKRIGVGMPKGKGRIKLK